MDGRGKLKIVFVLLVIILIFLSFRAFKSYQALIEKSVSGSVDVGSIRGWMTIAYVSSLFDVESQCMCNELNVSLSDCDNLQVRDLSERRGYTDFDGLVSDISPIIESCSAGGK